MTAGNQIPNADAGGAGGDTEGSSLTEEIVNFEVSKAIRTEVIEAPSKEERRTRRRLLPMV